MKISIAVAVTVLAGGLSLALAAPAQAAPTQTGPSYVRTTGSGADRTGGQLSEQDRMFLVAAHQGNLAEIAGGYVALAKSHNPDVRRIARRLIVDHRRLDAQVRAVARRYGVQLPNAPSEEQQRQLAAVARLSGRAFDLAWLRLQEAAHVETLALIRQELHTGQSFAVKAVAREAAPVVKEHLRMVREALAGYDDGDDD
jgi:putative membrane protein